MKSREILAIALGVLLIIGPLYFGETQSFVQTNGSSGLKTPQLPDGLLAWLGFFVLVFQAWIYSRQAGIMGEQNTLMKRQLGLMSGQLELNQNTAISQLRAYVCVVGATVALDGSDFPRNVVIEFKNSGQTPAHNVRIWINIWLEKHPLTIELPRRDDNFFGGTSIVAPGGLTILQSADVPPQSPEIRAKFGTIDCTLYAYGRASYTDAFGKRRHTDFRLIYGGQDGVTSRGRMHPDSSGNEAT